jgi:hypothetical protein
MLDGAGWGSRPFTEEIHMSRIKKALFGALAPLLVGGCSGDDSAAKTTTPAYEASATGQAYAALTEGRREDLTRVIADLDDAVVADPGDGRAVFYSAIMRFWQLGERIDLPESPAGLLPIAQTTVERFRDAQELLQNDDRVAAFGGLGKVIIANVLGNTALRDEGLADIDEGIRIFPAYAHFLRALASADAPAGSEEYAAVVPHMETLIDLCGMTKGASRSFAYIEGPLPSSLRPCNDDGMVPHVFEGFITNYGDMLLKAGRGAAEARAAYEGAKTAPRFDHWPFAAELQDRIDHADERAALYSDGDPSNDPTLWTHEHSCTGCHQDVR